LPVAANIRDRTNQAAAPMLDPLAFKAVSYDLILLLALTGLVLSFVSLRKEFTSDRPLHGLFPLILIIAGLCGVISVLTAYIDFRGDRGIWQAHVRESKHLGF
jgi:prepilin signal peptidase PulO-like enzyme (type II secretory pathway)